MIKVRVASRARVAEDLVRRREDSGRPVHPLLLASPHGAPGARSLGTQEKPGVESRAAPRTAETAEDQVIRTIGLITLPASPSATASLISASG
jgi:hypothetical protein